MLSDAGWRCRCCLLACSEVLIIDTCFCRCPGAVRARCQCRLSTKDDDDGLATFVVARGKMVLVPRVVAGAGAGCLFGRESPCVVGSNEFGRYTGCWGLGGVVSGQDDGAAGQCAEAGDLGAYGLHCRRPRGLSIVGAPRSRAS